MEKQFIKFTLNEENYGLDINQVEKIIKFQPITKIPQAPLFVEGVINLRGKIVPIMNLRECLSFEKKVIDEHTRMIITRDNHVFYGLIVDQVSEVIRLETDHFEAPPKITTSINHEYIHAVTKTENQLIILLDLDKILAIQPELISV